MLRAIIADDSDFLRKHLKKVLERNGITVVGVAKDGLEVLEKAESKLPDIILLDIHMPEMDGYRTCRHLQQRDKTKDIPVLFLTGSAEEESIVTGLAIGAQGYITKPYKEKELIARIHSAVKIEESKRQIATAALTDTLTGLYNRRFLIQRLKEEISRAKRKNRSLACAMIDIDFFKKINDTYGHDIGDYVLKELAEVVVTNVRGYDIIVRFGGEEFIALFPETNSAEALQVCKRICTKVETHEFKKGEEKISVTVSIGVFCSVETEVFDDEERYIKCADEALYKAKAAGRNRVVVYE
ncbi:MAG: diguanylate cyclase [Candidatus Omnitrophica bacterium]|nr:diguanylate cyclase [Candidatus Omnitrophota bacterium]